MSNSAAIVHAQGRPKKQQQSIFGRVLTSTGNAGDDLVSSTEYLADKSGLIYSKVYKEISKIGGSVAGITKDSKDFSDGLRDTLGGFSDQLRKNLEPVSDFMGSTLGTLTGVLNDPLGPNGLGNIATNLLNNISPGYGDQVNGSLKNLGLENLANLPSQLFSSVDHLITAIDNILAIPLTLLAEVYYGFMEIMKAISDLISSVMNAFTEFLFDFLDSIIPIKSILALLDSISNLANQIGGIAGTFLGANQITAFTQQITQSTRQIGGILANPMNLVFSSLPADVTNVINQIQSPQNIINSFLPPQLSEAFATISSMTGFGFNGNMGFGFQSVLQGVQGGVIRSVLSKYAAQYNVLAPLLAGTGNNKPGGNSATLINGQYNNALTDEAARQTSPQYGGGP